MEHGFLEIRDEPTVFSRGPRRPRYNAVAVYIQRILIVTS